MRSLPGQITTFRGRLAVIHDEIGMLRRDERPADTRALEPRRFDESSGVVARRIGEYRAATPFADRLLLLALDEQIATRLAAHALSLFELQRGAEESLALER